MRLWLRGVLEEVIGTDRTSHLPLGAIARHILVHSKRADASPNVHRTRGIHQKQCSIR